MPVSPVNEVEPDLTTVTNALGHVTEVISRDARGLPTVLDDVNDLRTELSYDARGRLISRTVKSSQGDVTTAFAYNAAGLITRMDLPTGAFVTYEYDAAQRLIAMQDSADGRVEYTLDADGNITQTDTRGPGGTLIQSQSQTFDELSRLRSVIDGLTNTTQYDYDLNDNLDETTDALSRSSTQAFDALEQISSATDAASGVTQQTYDARGNLTSVTDPRGVVTTYVYDGLDNLIQEVSADAGTTTYVYDAAGNLTQQTDARGVVADYSYDALNRLLSIAYPAGPAENITYTYDSGANALGRLSSFTDASGSTIYTFDDRGNATQDTRVIAGTTYTVSYSYDLLDQVTSTTYPSGRVVDTPRDALGRVLTVDHTLASVTEYLVDATQFDGRGALSALNYGNGTFQTRSYDAAGRINNITLTDSHNGAPVAYSDTAATHIGQDVAIDVIANDRDINGDTLTVSNVTLPTNGTVTINGDQTITYSPSGSTDYVDSFTYQVSDGAGPSNFATVTVNITDPGFVDSDGDGLSDALETTMGMDPNDASDAVSDIDGDGVSNYDEYLANTDPFVNDAGYGSAVTAGSPLAFWKLDETSGSTATDETSNNLDGSYQGTHTLSSSSPLPTGSAVDFDNGKVSVAYDSRFAFSGDYSVEFLAKWTTKGTGLLVGMKNLMTHNGWQIRTTGSGKIKFVEDNQFNVYSKSDDLARGEWHYVVATRRGGNLELWVDGELQDAQPYAGPSLVNYAPLNIMDHYYHSWDVEGTMDSVALTSRSLTQGEIVARFMSMGDKDNDGVPTHHEIATFHDPEDANDATSDVDGDGATAYDEYVAGTDPRLNPLGYAASIAADTPITHWPMDDVTSTVSDVSGNNHNGSYYGTYTQAQAGAITTGESVLFNGAWIQVPNDPALSPSADYTIEGYFKFNTSSNRNFGGIRNGSWGPYLFINRCDTTTNVGHLTFRDANLSGYRLCSNANNLDDNTWRHCAFVRRGSKLEIWIDGDLDSSLTLPTVNAHSVTTDFYLMGYSSKPVDGNVDEVAFFHHALSVSDIRQRIRQGEEPPPVVQVKGKQLPNNLDRWLTPGTLIALYDEPAQQFSLYQLDPDGVPVLQPMTNERLAATAVRALRTKDSVSVFLKEDETWWRQTKALAPYLQTVASSGLNESWAYTYDAVSNITQLSKPGGNEAFGYDNLDRLDDYTLPGSAQVTYTYDAVGNRLSETQSGITQSHTYGANDNRLVSQSGAALTYDSAGNRLTDGGGSRTYTYDQMGRVATVTDNSTLTATYVYNALGQRVNKVASGSDIDYVFDQSGTLIGEYNNGTALKEYVYIDGVPLAQIEGGITTWLHADHLGTPRLGTNSNGTIVWRWDSDPFGAAAPNEDPDGDMTDVTVNLRFPGQYFDMETGQYYNYFRTYDAPLGRYTQSDPIGLNGGLNRYSYVIGNPLSRMDIYGLVEYLVYDRSKQQLSWVSGEEGQNVTVYPANSGIPSQPNPNLLNGPTPDGIYTITAPPVTPAQSAYCDRTGNCWFSPLVPHFPVPIDPTTGQPRCTLASQGGTGRCGLHADGNAPGTIGCIGLSDPNTGPFLQRLKQYNPSPTNPLPVIVQ